MAEVMVAQGSREWLELRLGRITSTMIKGIVEGKPKKLNSLLREIRSPQMVSFDAPALRWGRHYEEQARSIYIMETDISAGWNLRESGFWLHDDIARVGGSPDGIWQDVMGRVLGGVEIKCPYNPLVHWKYCRWGLPVDHQWQVFFLMWLTGADFWDFVSYDPRATETGFFQQRVFRDQYRVALMESKIKEFLAVLENNEWFDEVLSARDVLASGLLSDYLNKDKTKNG